MTGVCTRDEAPAMFWRAVEEIMRPAVADEIDTVVVEELDAGFRGNVVLREGLVSFLGEINQVRHLLRCPNGMYGDAARGVDGKTQGGHAGSGLARR